MKISEEQFMQIEEDQFPAEMLTDAQVIILATMINERINLPFIGEEKEQIVFIKLVKFVDRNLYMMLPNEYYSLIHDATDGISQKEADLIVERVTPLINNLVNIPILTEKMEAKLISLLLGIIMKAMVKGEKLEE